MLNIVNYVTKCLTSYLNSCYIMTVCIVYLTTHSVTFHAMCYLLCRFLHKMLIIIYNILYGEICYVVLLNVTFLCLAIHHTKSYQIMFCNIRLHFLTVHDVVY
jgi:hypothetical protein